MYLIIIEGTDNIGKDTVINELVKLFESVTLIHCDKPKHKYFQSYEQDRHFLKLSHNIVDGKYDNTDVIILNRSHYGEYVYGSLYRNRDKEQILKMILACDYILLDRKDLKIKYVQLYSTSTKLRKDNDDNNSISTKEDNMAKETELFNEVFEESLLDKCKIQVNNGDKFRSKEEIYKNILDFINE